MNEFIEYLKSTSKKVDAYKSAMAEYPLFPKELEIGTFEYFLRGGKRLRPAVLMLCAGALGGEKKENAALPCAVGLEFYHNYTLIHDDIIDNDDTRRGKPSVHALVGRKIESEETCTREESRIYGTDVAILAGDALHSIAVDTITKLSENGVDPKVILKIISSLEGREGLKLISGETVDTKNGIIFGRNGLNKVSENEIIEMMRGKTGALFAICALSGALIGLDSDNDSAPEVKSLTSFAENCGIAFQLKDDILGITSTEEELGKPILSDIREGKLTVLLLHSFNNSDEKEKQFLLDTLGKSKDNEKIFAARDIILKNGGLEYTAALAEKYIRLAKESLMKIEKNKYRDLLEKWSDFMFDRKK